MRRFARFSCIYAKNIKETTVPINQRLLSTSCVQLRPCLALEWETPRENIFQHLNNQQKRGYAPTTSNTTIQCWNCKAEQKQGEAKMVCGECGHLQDVNMEIVSRRKFN